MEGIEILARRYAKEAAKMALAEKDPIRKHELETIAETCERVPKYPARNFVRHSNHCFFTKSLFLWNRMQPAIIQAE